MIRDYYVTTPRATGRITVDDQGVIVGTPPIWHHWKGRTMKDFGHWLWRMHGDNVARIVKMEADHGTR